MKQLLILFAVITYTNNSLAQITKGNWIVGGNFSYSNSQSKGNDAINSKTRMIDISTNFGYFIQNRIATGLILNTQLVKDEYTQNNGTINTIVQNNLGAGPFVRYYFLGQEKRVNILSEGSIFYSILSNKSTGSVENKFKSLEYNIYAGSVIFLNSSVGMEFLFGYNKSNAISVDSRGESIRFKIGFQIHLEKE